VLTDEELRSLVDAKMPLIMLRGRWIAVWPEEFRIQLQAATAHLSEREERATPARMRDTSEDFTLGPNAAVPADWSQVELAEVDVPEEVRKWLRPYQLVGVRWLAALDRLRLGGLLADDMGLGKTLQTLALIASDCSTSGHPTLVVAPLSVLQSWEEDKAKFAPDRLRMYVHQGPSRRHQSAFHDERRTSDVVLTTYDTLVNDRDEFLAVEWHRVVLDEAQNIKNPTHSAAG
jgi:SNF2 family DNA or RNA helicase